jgi:hypothetical protein
MEFSATSTNITEILVAALAIVALALLMRKRYDSNLPLLFYFVLIVFMNMSDRELNPYLLYFGLITALVLRFEFMGTGFAKFVAILTTGSLGLIIWSMMSEVFA